MDCVLKNLMNPEIAKAINALVAQRVASALAVNAPKKETEAPAIVEAPIVQRSASSASSCSSSSGSSLASASSLVTPPQTRPRPNKKRKNFEMLPDAERQLVQDRNFLLRPVLTFFDAAFLAPKMSIMFTRKLCTSTSKPRVKKNADMEVNIFNPLMCIVLRQVLGNDYDTAQHDIKQRYILAGGKIVKKRRANHVQNWRPDKQNTHKALRYGGNLGKMPPVTYLTEKEKLMIRGFLRNQNNMMNALDLTVNAAMERIDKPDPAPAPAPTPTPAPDMKPKQLQFEPDFAPVKCDDCGKDLTADEVYPKHQDGWASGITVSKCLDCWNKNVQEDLMAKMDERIEKQNENEPRMNVGKPCKCGSLNHKSIRHSDCPLNPRNLVQKEVPGQTQPPKKKAKKKTTPSSPKGTTSASTSASPKEPSAKLYKVGDRVDGFFGGWAGPRLLFAGQITKVHHDGTYDILYDDGDREVGVAPEFIQPEEPELSPPPKRARSDSPRPEGLPPAPAKPLGRQRSKKALLGRTFFDEGTVEDGKTIFEPGDFIVKQIKDNGRLLCVRKSNVEDSEEYLVGAVREMVVDYEKKHGIFE